MRTTHFRTQPVPCNKKGRRPGGHSDCAPSYPASPLAHCCGCSGAWSALASRFKTQRLTSGYFVSPKLTALKTYTTPADRRFILAEATFFARSSDSPFTRLVSACRSIRASCNFCSNPGDANLLESLIRGSLARLDIRSFSIMLGAGLPHTKDIPFTKPAKR